MNKHLKNHCCQKICYKIKKLPVRLHTIHDNYTGVRVFRLLSVFLSMAELSRVYYKFPTFPTLGKTKGKRRREW